MSSLISQVHNYVMLYICIEQNQNIIFLFSSSNIDSPSCHHLLKSEIFEIILPKIRFGILPSDW